MGLTCLALGKPKMSWKTRFCQFFFGLFFLNYLQKLKINIWANSQIPRWTIPIFTDRRTDNANFQCNCNYFDSKAETQNGRKRKEVRDKGVGERQRQKVTELAKEVSLEKFQRGEEPTTSNICIKRKMSKSPICELFQWIEVSFKEHLSVRRSKVW